MMRCTSRRSASASAWARRARATRALCHVDAHGSKPVPACCTPAKDGMVVDPDNADVQRSVKQSLAMLRSRHPGVLSTCEVADVCKLKDLSYRLQVGGRRVCVRGGSSKKKKNNK